jgi:hypothetical protein
MNPAAAMAPAIMPPVGFGAPAVKPDDVGLVLLLDAAPGQRWAQSSARELAELGVLDLNRRWPEL